MKKQKGITLIALVITIIIMLILVVVTIDFSTEGGLINKSKKAVDVANAEFARDELLQYITKDFDLTTNTVNFEKLAERLAKSGNWKDTIVLEKYLMVTNSQTGETYKVDINGEISSAKNPKDLTDLEKFLLGENGQGKDILGLLENYEYEEGVVNGYSNNSSKVYLKSVNSNSSSNGWILLEYEDKLYTVNIKNNEEEYSIDTLPDPGVELVLELDENSKVGKLVAYKGELYKIIYDDEIHGTQMVNVNINIPGIESTIEVQLGYYDSSVEDWTKQEIIDEVDFDNSGTLSLEEKATYSYNHAIETLNNAAKEAFEGEVSDKIIKDVRCLGTNPKYPYVAENKKYTSDLLKNTKFNGKLADRTNTEKSDYIRLIGLDLITLYRGSTGYKPTYWYASTFVETWDGDIDFGTFTSIDVDAIGLNSHSVIWITKDSNYEEMHCNLPETHSVYPVLVLQDGILDQAEIVDGVYNLLALEEQQ